MGVWPFSLEPSHDQEKDFSRISRKSQVPLKQAAPVERSILVMVGKLQVYVVAKE
jgi:hypothetical protein